MDKILANIYAMEEREYDVFKTLVGFFLVALTFFIYYAVQIPFKLEERERLIQEWESTHAPAQFEELPQTGNYDTFKPEVLYYGENGK